MKTIVETLSEREFVDLCKKAGLYEDLEAEELNGIYEDRNRFNKTVKKAAKLLGLKTRKVGNRLIIVDRDGQAIPAVSPATSGLAIQSGQAGKSTFFIPAGGEETKFGVKGSSVADVLADFEKQKKSVFESAEGEIANLNEKFELEGNGLYGPDIDTEESSTIISGLLSKLVRRVFHFLFGVLLVLVRHQSLRTFLRNLQVRRDLLQRT